MTTSLILIECGDGLSRLRRRADALRLRSWVLAFPRIEVLHVGPELESQAWSLFGSRPDREWGMTDCVSFVVMQDRGMTDGFTADRHFGQAGFRAQLAAA